MMQLHTGERALWLRDKGHSDTKQQLSGAGATITGAHTGSALEAVQVPAKARPPELVPQLTPSPHASHSCPIIASLWGESAGAGSGKSKHLMGTDRAGLNMTPRASAPAAWDMPPPPTGW